MQQSFIFLAEGFEEIEALTTIDVMRRAGMDIKSVSITSSKDVTGAHGITVKADLTFKEADYGNSEWLILPGGMPGATNLASDQALCDLLKVHKGKIAAICAAPAVVLAPLGLLEGKESTGYPGFETELLKHGAIVSQDMVVSLDKLITGKGPAAAMAFALAIVASSMGHNSAQQIGESMLFYKKDRNYYF